MQRNASGGKQPSINAFAATAAAQAAAAAAAASNETGAVTNVLTSESAPPSPATSQPSTPRAGHTLPPVPLFDATSNGTAGAAATNTTGADPTPTPDAVDIAPASPLVSPETPPAVIRRSRRIEQLKQKIEETEIDADAADDSDSEADDTTNTETGLNGSPSAAGYSFDPNDPDRIKRPKPDRKCWCICNAYDATTEWLSDLWSKISYFLFYSCWYERRRALLFGVWCLVFALHD